LIQIKNIRDRRTDDKYPASARSMLDYNYVFNDSDLANYNKPFVCLYWQLGFHGQFKEIPHLIETRQIQDDDYRRMTLCCVTSGFNHYRINNENVSDILQNILVSHISPFEAEWKVNNEDEGDNWREDEIKIMHPLGYNYEGYNYENE